LVTTNVVACARLRRSQGFLAQITLGVCRFLSVPAVASSVPTLRWPDASSLAPANGQPLLPGATRAASGTPSRHYARVPTTHVVVPRG
jgi:hypothetical protein